MNNYLTLFCYLILLPAALGVIGWFIFQLFSEQGIGGVRMDSPRKKLLCAGLAVIILMGIFPPWKMHSTVSTAGGWKAIQSYVYAPIFSPPKPDFPHLTSSAHLDLVRLFIQWLIVAFAIGGGLVIMKH